MCFVPGLRGRYRLLGLLAAAALSLSAATGASAGTSGPQDSFYKWVKCPSVNQWGQLSYKDGKQSRCKFVVDHRTKKVVAIVRGTVNNHSKRPQIHKNCGLIPPSVFGDCKWTRELYSVTPNGICSGIAYGKYQGSGKSGDYGRGKGRNKGKGRDYGKGKGRDYDKGEGRDYDKGRDYGKGKGRDYDKGRGKGKGKGRDYDKGHDYGKGKGRDHDKGRDYGKGKGRDNDKGRDYGKGKGRDNDKGRDYGKGKGRDSDKGRGYGKGKGSGKDKGRDYGKGKRRGRGDSGGKGNDEEVV